MSKKPRLERPIVHVHDMPDEMWQQVFARVTPRLRRLLRCTCRQWRRCVYAMTREVAVQHPEPVGVLGARWTHLDTDKHLEKIKGAWDTVQRLGRDLGLYVALHRLSIVTSPEDLAMIVQGMDAGLKTRLSYLGYAGEASWAAQPLPLTGFHVFTHLKRLTLHRTWVAVADLVHLPVSLEELELELWKPHGKLHLERFDRLRELYLFIRDIEHWHTDWINTTRPLHVLSVTGHEWHNGYLFSGVSFNHTPDHLILNGVRHNMFRGRYLPVLHVPQISFYAQVRSLELNSLAFVHERDHDRFYRNFPSLEVLVENNLAWTDYTGMVTHTLEGMRTLLPRLQYYGCVRPSVY